MSPPEVGYAAQEKHEKKVTVSDMIFSFQNTMNFLMTMGQVQGAPAKRVRDLRFEKNLITGLISLVLLAIMNNSKEAMYGYQIARSMEGDGRAGVELKQGTIYPVLRSMEKKGFLKSELKASDAGPARKYYSITKKGRDKLTVWKDAWFRTQNFVDTILGGEING